MTEAKHSPLLPCPFCNEFNVGFGRTGQKWQAVACNECGAEGPCTEIDRDLIVKKWNTRAPTSLHGELVAALEVARDLIKCTMETSSDIAFDCGIRQIEDVLQKAKQQ